jgi:hypothetical protein
VGGNRRLERPAADAFQRNPAAEVIGKRRSSSMSRWPWVVALTFIRSMMPWSAGLAFAMSCR